MIAVVDEQDRLRRDILAGKPDAIEDVQKFLGPLIKSQIVNRDDWEDLRQHCLLEICAYLERTPTIHNMWALIRRIAINSIMDFNQRARFSAGVILSPRHATDPGIDRIEQAASNQQNPLEKTIARDQIRYVLGSIGAKCREIFRLLFIEDRPYAEAAERLGITEGNLRVRLNRCRRHAIALRDRLERSYP